MADVTDSQHDAFELAPIGDEVPSPFSIAELADGWWAHHRLAFGSRDERKALAKGEPADVFAKWEAARDVIDAGGPGALDLVWALVQHPTVGDAARVDDRLQAAALVGAGPLEDLICEHGDALADDLEQLARREPDFARAMRSVRLEPGTLSARTCSRLSPWLETS